MIVSLVAISPGLQTTVLAREHQIMTKDKFQLLCEQVLVPRLGDFLHGQFTDLIELQDSMGREIRRLCGAVERLAVALERHEDNR